jgi:lipoprotein-anchoring transpeptidase ErfK/SrfK
MRLGAAEAYYDGKYIDIDLRTQTLTAFQDRAPVYRYKISSGKWSTPTPVGTFSILNKTSRAYSPKYGLYMPWWMSFTSYGHGIHELPEWPSGTKEGSGHLGTPVSHGCVRLGIGPAKTIYDWTNIGNRVYVHK